MADELPPVVAKFVADVSDFARGVAAIVGALKDLQKNIDQTTAAAAAMTGQDTALAAAANAAANASQNQARAAIEDAAAMEAAAHAARAETDATIAAAAAQREQNAAQSDAGPLMNDLLATMKKIAGAERDMAAGAHSAGNAVSFWKKHFQLSGGLFGSIPVLGTVTGLELVLHGAMEALAVLIPAISVATMGLLGWAAAAAQSGVQIYHQFMNIHTVATALNQTIPPLRNSFQQLSNAVRPQVFELLGTYLDMSSHSTGVFASLIQRTGDFLDHMFARLEVHLAKGGTGMQTFIDTGIKDLTLLGQIFGNIGKLVITFADAAMKTHIAEILLGIIAAASNLIGVLARIPAPLLTAFVGLHGVALWGGLAVTQLRNLALAALQSASAIGQLNGPATAFARAIGASSDQLAAMGEASPALKSIAQDIANGVPGAYQLAQGLEVSDKSLSRIVAKTPAVEAVAKALGVGAQDIANFAIAVDKSGGSMAALAEKSAGSASRVAELTSGLEKGAADAANLAMAFTATGKAGVTAEEAAAKASSGFTAAGNSGGFFAGIMSKLPSILGNVWVDLALLAAALIGVGIYLGLMPDKTQKWINTLNQSVNTASNLNMLGVTISALAANTEQLAQAQKTATGNTTELANNQADLTSKLQLELQHVGEVQKAYGVSMPQALALLQTAGVKATDLFTKQGNVWAADMEQVHGLTEGYKAMGQQIGMVGSDMNVLLVSESQQLSAMQKINQAYDQFTQLVAAPISSVLTLAQGLNTFQQDAKTAGASMSGLGSASITLQQQFQTVFGNIQQSFDAFRNAQALSGGAGNFTQFVKDATAALIPLAGSNQAAAAQISALAQEAGGPATTNLNDLAKWAGNVHNPLQKMYDAAQNAAKSTYNLSQDAAQLTNTLQQDLNPALAQASFNALGGQKTLNDFSTALVKFGPNSQPAIDAGRKVAEMFLSIDKSNKSAKAQFVGWAESMGLTAAQADQLWGKVSKGVHPMESLRKSLAKTNEQVVNLGKPGLWGQIEHFFMSVWDHAEGPVVRFFTQTIPHAAESVVHFFSSTFPHAIESVWNHIWSALIAPVINAFESVKNAIVRDFDNWWKTHGEAVKDIAHRTWEGVKNVTITAWNVLMSVLKPAIALLEKIWKSSWDIIHGVVKAAWDIIKGVTKGALQIISGIFKAGWDIIKNVVITVWNIIKTVVTTAFHVVLDVIGIVLDLITGHWRTAWNDLKSLARDALNGVVQIIKSITSGFITLLLQAGKDLIQGLINGIGSMAGGVYNAVSSIASGIWHSVTGFFGVKSPSTKFMYLGQMLVQGLILGTQAGQKQAVSAYQQLSQAIMNAVSAGEISSQRGTRLQLWLTEDNARLNLLAKARRNIINQIRQGEQYAQQVTASTVSTYTLMSAAQPAAGGAPPTVPGIIGALWKDVAQIRQFKNNIMKLKRMGLNKAYLDQLIQAGPQQAGPVAAELAAGSWAEIQQINRAEAAIGTSAKQLGQQAANVMFDSGKMAGKGFLSGLKAQEKAITDEMKKIADVLVRQLKKDLGISSPSRVMMEHGRMVAEGFARGIEDGVMRVQRASRMLAAGVSLGASRSSILMTGGGSVIVINLRSDITGRVDNRVLWQAMQQETFRYNIRNSGLVTGGLKPGSA